MSLLIALSTFIFITLGGVGLYLRFFRQHNPLLERLQTNDGAKGAPAEAGTETAAEGFAERMTKPIQRLAPPSVSEAEKLQKRLMQAGYFAHNAPIIFHAIQLATMFGFPLLTGLGCLVSGVTFSNVLK